MVSLFFMYKKYKSLCYFFIKYKIFFFPSVRRVSVFHFLVPFNESFKKKTFSIEYGGFGVKVIASKVWLAVGLLQCRLN